MSLPIRAFACLSGLVVTLLALSAGQPALALPIFAQRTGFTCETCHTVIPHLNPFGEAFLRDGFRSPEGIAQHRVAIPIALKVNLAYTSDADPSGLPRAIVDEVELLAGGPVANNFSYRLEQYVVDGGVPGKTRDAWISYTSRPAFADGRRALQVTAGEFTLPLPVDPETQRDTENHYAVFDQTVGANPFNFFDDKIGVDVAYGKPGGADLHVVATDGHDPQSGISSDGMDVMLVGQAGSPQVLISAYKYVGSRAFGPVDDRFWRQALAFSTTSGQAEFDALAQSGNDSSADGSGLDVASSGGFAQLRWTFSEKAFAVARFDRVDDALAGRTSSLTASFIIRPARNARITIEDVVRGSRQTFNAGCLFAL
jgi:hypothetical protein